MRILAFIDKLIEIIKNYDSSKLEKNVSIEEVTDLIANHKFNSEFMYKTAIDILTSYKQMRTDLDPIGEIIKSRV